MLFIVGMYKHEGVKTVYNVLLVTKDEARQAKYEIAQVPEDVLLNKMSRGLKLENANLLNGKLQGTTGSLDRFNVTTATKPLVIISEIVDGHNNTLGYRVADCKGVVKAVKLQDLLVYASKFKDVKGAVAIQNGMYIPRTDDTKAHIRSFKAEGYPKEVITTANNVDKYKAQTTYTTNKQNVAKLYEIFNHEQIEQLKLGREHGVDIAVYANKAFSAEQMKEIREGLENKVRARLYADPKFSTVQMRRLKAEMILGYDVSAYANPAYSNGQMTQIKLGALSGVDISLYANPKTSSDEMSEIRMRLEAGIWCDCEASKIDASHI